MSDELMKRLQKGRENAADRIEALTTMVEQLGREVNVARYGQPDFAWSIHKAAMADLQAERDHLRIALTDAESYLKRGLDKSALSLISYTLKEYPDATPNA